MICRSCKKHYDSVQKGKTYHKTCNDCRRVRKQRVRRKSQPANTEDNISTKSSMQQSQSSISNTLETITHNTNKTQFYNIDNDNDNMNEPFEHRKLTINKRLNHIHISLDQLKNKYRNHLMMMLIC